MRRVPHHARTAVMQSSAKTVSQFLKSQPADVRADLTKLRGIVRAVVPSAAETMRYGMPTYVDGEAMVAARATDVISTRTPVAYAPACASTSAPNRQVMKNETAVMINTTGRLARAHSGAMPYCGR